MCSNLEPLNNMALEPSLPESENHKLLLFSNPSHSEAPEVGGEGHDPQMTPKMYFDEDSYSFMTEYVRVQDVEKEDQHPNGPTNQISTSEDNQPSFFTIHQSNTEAVGVRNTVNDAYCTLPEIEVGDYLSYLDSKGLNTFPQVSCQLESISEVKLPLNETQVPVLSQQVPFPQALRITDTSSHSVAYTKTPNEETDISNIVFNDNDKMLDGGSEMSQQSGSYVSHNLAESSTLFSPAEPGPSGLNFSSVCNEDSGEESGNSVVIVEKPKKQPVTIVLSDDPTSSEDDELVYIRRKRTSNISVPNDSPVQGKGKGVKHKSRCQKGDPIRERLESKKDEIFDLKPDPDGGRKTPEDTKDLTCAICLSEFENRAFLDKCFHSFCYACILQWAEVIKQCPLCKTAFMSLVHSVTTDLDYQQHFFEDPDTSKAVPVITSRFVEQVVNELTEQRRRFQYRTTMAARTGEPQEERRNRLHRRNLQQMKKRIHRSGRLRSIASVERRKMIYRVGMTIKEVKTRGRPRERDISVEFIKNNPATTHRLVGWLLRDIRVLVGDNEGHVNFLMHLILSLITKTPMDSEEFYNQLQPFFMNRTRQFIRELTSFAKSPYDMEGYDANVVYDMPSTDTTEAAANSSAAELRATDYKDEAKAQRSSVSGASGNATITGEQSADAHPPSLVHSLWAASNTQVNTHNSCSSDDDVSVTRVVPGSGGISSLEERVNAHTYGNPEDRSFFQNCRSKSAVESESSRGSREEAHRRVQEIRQAVTRYMKNAYLGAMSTQNSDRNSIPSANSSQTARNDSSTDHRSKSIPRLSDIDEETGSYIRSAVHIAAHSSGRASSRSRSRSPSLHKRYRRKGEEERFGFRKSLSRSPTRSRSHSKSSSKSKRRRRSGSKARSGSSSSARISPVGRSKSSSRSRSGSRSYNKVDLNTECWRSQLTVDDNTLPIVSPRTAREETLSPAATLTGTARPFPLVYTDATGCLERSSTSYTYPIPHSQSRRKKSSKIRKSSRSDSNTTLTSGMDKDGLERIVGYSDSMPTEEALNARTELTEGESLQNVDERLFSVPDLERTSRRSHSHKRKKSKHKRHHKHRLHRASPDSAFPITDSVDTELLRGFTRDDLNDLACGSEQHTSKEEDEVSNATNRSEQVILSEIKKLKEEIERRKALLEKLSRC